MENTLKLSTREKMSSSALDKLRKTGQVPGVIYGGGEDGKMFSVGALTLEECMKGGCFFNTLLDVELDGKKITVLPREAQAHVVTDKVVHIECQQVDQDTLVDVLVPIFVVGSENSEIIKRGGRVHKALKGIKIRCKAGMIPKAVKLDVSELPVAGVIKIGQLNLPEEMDVRHPEHLTIVKMVGKREKAADKQAAEEQEAAAE